MPSRIEIAEALDMPVEELDSLLRQALTTSSLDAPVNGEEGRSFLGDLIADSSLGEPLDKVEQRIHHEQLGRWMSHLSEQERTCSPCDSVSTAMSATPWRRSAVCWKCPVSVCVRLS